MKEKKVEAIKTQLEFQSIKNIFMFLGFVYFYKKFIKKFGRIVVSFTSML